MLCEDCHKNEATVQVTKIVNNEKIVLSLCNDCAAKRGFHSPLEGKSFPLADMLSNLGKKPLSSGKDAAFAGVNLECPRCKLTFEKFIKLGRFGCGECYKAFRPRLESMMRKIHGSSLHKGKLPETAPNQPLPVKEEARLESELRRAIKAEDFERAADLRDKLKTLKEERLAGKHE